MVRFRALPGPFRRSSPPFLLVIAGHPRRGRRRKLLSRWLANRRGFRGARTSAASISATIPTCSPRCWSCRAISNAITPPRAHASEEVGAGGLDRLDLADVIGRHVLDPRVEYGVARGAIRLQPVNRMFGGKPECQVAIEHRLPVAVVDEEEGWSIPALPDQHEGIARGSGAQQGCELGDGRHSMIEVNGSRMPKRHSIRANRSTAPKDVPPRSK